MKVRIKIIDRRHTPPKESFEQFNMTHKTYEEAEAKRLVAMWNYRNRLNRVLVDYEIVQ